MTRTLKLMSALSLTLAVAACSGEESKARPAPAAKPAPTETAPAAAPAPAPAPTPPVDPTASWKETKAQGFVVAIGHPHESTLQALAEWLPRAAERGIVLAPISAVLRKRNGWD